MYSELPYKDLATSRFIIYTHLAIYLCSIVLNGIEIVCIICRRKISLRKVIDAVLLNVAVSDWLTGICGACAWTLAHIGPYKHYYFIPVGFCRYNSIISFFLLALDRFVMVKYPMAYRLSKSNKIVLMAIILSWMTASLLKIIQEIMFTGCPVYATALLFSFTPIWILLVVLNVMTHQEIKRNRKTIEVFSNAAYGDITTVKGSTAMKSMKVVHKMRRKQEKRDVYTSVFATIAFLLLTMPDTILSTISIFSDDLSLKLNRETALIVTGLLSTRSLITPTIYLYQNRRRK